MIKIIRPDKLFVLGGILLVMCAMYNIAVGLHDIDLAWNGMVAYEDAVDYACDITGCDYVSIMKLYVAGMKATQLGIMFLFFGTLAIGFGLGYNETKGETMGRKKGSKNKQKKEKEEELPE